MPVEECIEEAGNHPISVRWLDISKGDGDNLEYRSRLVAQELKKDKRESVSVATSPFEAKTYYSVWVSQKVLGMSLESLRKV